MVYPYNGRHVVRISDRMLLDTMYPCPGPYVVRTSDILFIRYSVSGRRELGAFCTKLGGF